MSSWINRGYSHRLPSDFTWDSQDPPLGWSGWVVQICAAGQLRVQIDDNEPILTKAGAVICSRVEYHRTRIRAMGSMPLELEWVHLPDTGALDLDSTSLLMMKNVELGIQLFSRCIERLNPPNSDKPGAEAWLRAFFVEMRDNGRSLGDATSTRKSKQVEALQDLMDEIVEMPGRQWYFQSVAEAMGWSYTHFYNRFVDVAGMGPQDFLAQQRVESIKRLLRMSELRISEIADRCGFCNQFALARFFKHRVGMSPTQYRRLPIDDLREGKLS